MNDVKNLEGFLTLSMIRLRVRNCLSVMGRPFWPPPKAIEKLLAEDWPAIEASLRDDGLSTDDQQRLLHLLESINALETKTRARLAWSEDFEAHMRRAMETTS